VKSRAERNEIYYNWIEGAYYHELELIGPDGGDGGNERLKREDSDVAGNVFWKKTKPAGDTEYFNVTRIGGDGTGESHGRYRFVNNTFLCGSRPVFRMFDSLESVEMHNNVFYRIDGNGVAIMRTLEALWTTGAAVIAGQNNWIQNGSTQVPSQWTGNIFGNLPGFIDLANGNVRPATGSPLLNAGISSPAGPPGFPFPSGLFPPAYIPPGRVLLAAGTGQPRNIIATVDVGAFEFDPSLSVSTFRTPVAFALDQNYPNPFNPETRIHFSVGTYGPASPAGGHTSLRIYDILGSLVATLVDHDLLPGSYTVSLDAAGRASGFAGGVYFYTLHAGNQTETKKMLLLK
jgi:hypothetical protein